MFFFRVDRLRLFWLWLLDIVCYTLATSAVTARQAMEKMNKSNQPSSAADPADGTQATKVASDGSLYPLASIAPLSGPIARFLVETVMTTEHPEHPLYSTLMNYMFLFPYMKTNKVSCATRGIQVTDTNTEILLTLPSAELKVQ